MRQPPPRPLRPLRPPCLRCRLRLRRLRLRRSRNEHDPRRRLEHTSALNLLAKVVRLAPPRLLLPPLAPPLVPLVPKERTCNRKRLARLLVRLLVLNRLLARLNPPLLRLDPSLPHHDDRFPDAIAVSRYRHRSAARTAPTTRRRRAGARRPRRTVRDGTADGGGIRQATQACTIKIRDASKVLDSKIRDASRVRDARGTPQARTAQGGHKRSEGHLT